MGGKGRAPCCDKSQVKRGPWSPSEDLRLISFIQKHGHDNWRALPKQAGNLDYLFLFLPLVTSMQNPEELSFFFLVIVLFFQNNETHNIFR